MEPTKIEDEGSCPATATNPRSKKFEYSNIARMPVTVRLEICTGTRSWNFYVGNQRENLYELQLVTIKGARTLVE
jgi:hypothetical protein